MCFSSTWCRAYRYAPGIHATHTYQFRLYIKQEEVCQLAPGGDLESIKAAIEEDGENFDSSNNKLPPWIVHEETMSPLLQVYDQRIQTLEDALEDNRAVIEQKTQQLDVLEQVRPHY